MMVLVGRHEYVMICTPCITLTAMVEEISRHIMSIQYCSSNVWIWVTLSLRVYVYQVTFIGLFYDIMTLSRNFYLTIY